MKNKDSYFEDFIYLMCWIVERDIKPCISFTTYSKKDSLRAKKLIKKWNSKLLCIIKNYPPKTKYYEVSLFKERHVGCILNSICDKKYQAISDVLSAYIYGIPPHQVQKYFEK